MQDLNREPHAFSKIGNKWLFMRSIIIEKAQEDGSHPKL